MLPEHQFSAILNKLHAKTFAYVDLYLSIAQLEQILELALQNACLDKITFNNQFLPDRVAVFTNLYIAAIYHKQIERAQQLEAFQKRVTKTHPNIDILSGRFDFHANICKHNVELDNLTAAEVLDHEGQNLINRFKHNFRALFMIAIANGDIRLLQRTFIYGGNDFNINEPIVGRLPIEEACARNQVEVVRELLYTCKAYLTTKSNQGTDAIDQIIRYNSRNVLSFLIANDLLIPSKFNSSAGNFYDPQTDIFKRVIDTDKHQLLSLLLGIYKEKINTFFDAEFIKKLFLYAHANNKQQCTLLLHPTYATLVRTELSLARLIVEGDEHGFKSILMYMVDLNFMHHGIGILELICQYHRINFFRYLLETPFLKGKLIRYSFDLRGTDNYNSAQDIIYLAVKYNSLDILKYYLHFLDIDLNALSIIKFDPMLDLAEQFNATSVKDYLQSFKNKQIQKLQHLFDLAVARKYNSLRNAIYEVEELDQQVDGQALIHVLCAQDAIAIVNTLLRLDVEYNEPNKDGDFPITICAQNGNLDLVQKFLHLPAIRLCSFNEAAESNDPDYNAKLDLVKIALDKNDSELLKILLRYTTTHPSFGTLNSVSLNRMLAYANNKQRHIVASLLHSYINTVDSGVDIFTEEQADLDDFRFNPQNINSTDRCLVPIAKKLAEIMGVSIHYLSDSKMPYYYLDKTFKVDEIFSKLKAMIESITDADVNYAFYRLLDPNDQSESHDNYEFDRWATLEEYKSFANHTYDSIKHGLKGFKGHFSTWRSVWTHPGSEEYIEGLGLSVKEIWALAIEASLDPEPFEGVYLEPKELEQRKKDLVRALVECARTYNTENEPGYDLGGPCQPSCVHGHPPRGLLKLHAKHRAVYMTINSMSWATQLVKEETKLFFEQYEDKELKKLLILQTSQLSAEEEDKINTFYDAARDHIERILTDKVGLIASGGYLFQRELDEAVFSVENVELYDLKDFENAKEVYSTPEFSFTEDKTIYGLDNIALKLYKLPLTTDALLNAALLSAYDQQIYVPAACDTAQKIRTLIHNILDFATCAPDNIKFAFTPNLPKFTKPNRTLRIIQAKFDCLTPTSLKEHTKEEAKAEEAKIEAKRDAMPKILEPILNNGTPTMLMLQILSHLWQVSFSIYSFGGRQVATTSCLALHCELPENFKTLNIAMPCTQDNKYMPDFSKPYALISAVNQDKAAEFVKKLDIKNVATQLTQDQKLYEDFTIMPDREISYDGKNLQQIKIPQNGDSAYAAVLYAAKNIGSVIANDIKMPNDLRYKVYFELLSNQNAQELSYELQLVNEPGHPASIPEVQAMAKLLNINIFIFHNDLPMSAINITDAQQTIYLQETNGHFNILTPKNKWKLENPCNKRMRMSAKS